LSYYEVLGIPPNASPDEIRHAYLAKAGQFHPDRFTGAPREVGEAMTKAAAIVDNAGRVLGDPTLRVDYDRKLKTMSNTTSTAARTGGLEGEPSVPSSTSGFDSPLEDVIDALEAHAAWLEPNAASPSRHVTVPDVTGHKASDVFYEVAKADLHINFVRLTDNPAPVDGVVVAQDPPAGTSVRRHSILTVEVWHPSADETRANAGSATP
jgi:curved DNA-binding protein CbpA